MTTKQPVLQRLTTGSSILTLVLILFTELLDTLTDRVLPGRRARDDRELLIDRRTEAIEQAKNRRATAPDRRRNRNFATRGFFSMEQHDRRLTSPGRRAADWKYG